MCQISCLFGQFLLLSGNFCLPFWLGWWGIISDTDWYLGQTTPIFWENSWFSCQKTSVFWGNSQPPLDNFCLSGQQLPGVSVKLIIRTWCILLLSSFIYQIETPVALTKSAVCSKAVRLAYSLSLEILRLAELHVLTYHRVGNAGAGLHWSSDSATGTHSCWSNFQFVEEVRWVFILLYPVGVWISWWIHPDTSVTTVNTPVGQLLSAKTEVVVCARQVGVGTLIVQGQLG